MINASDESLLLHVVTAFDFVTLKGNIINKWYLINYVGLYFFKKMYTSTKIYAVPVQALYWSPETSPYQVKRSFQTLQSVQEYLLGHPHQRFKICHSLPTFYSIFTWKLFQTEHTDGWRQCFWCWKKVFDVSVWTRRCSINLSTFDGNNLQ